MNQLKGFLFAKPTGHKPKYLFQKIGKDGVQTMHLSFSHLLHQKQASKDKASILFGNDFTLCFTEQVNENTIKYLSIIGSSLIFDINLDTKTVELAIYRNTKLLGKRKDPIELKYTKGFLGFGKSLDKVATCNALLDLFSKAAHLSVNISELLAMQGLQVFKLSRPAKKFVNPNSYATNATPFSGDHHKIMSLMPSRNGHKAPPLQHQNGRLITELEFAEAVKEFINFGVVAPTILIQTRPLTVAVYSSDIDCAVILNFGVDTDIAKKYRNHPIGHKMVSVNVYYPEAMSGLTDGVEVDLIEGPNSSGTWKSVCPYVLDFIVDDDDLPLLNYAKNKFQQKDWDKLIRLKNEYFQKFPKESRLGFPMCNGLALNAFIQRHCQDLLQKSKDETAKKEAAQKEKLERDRKLKAERAKRIIEERKGQPNVINVPNADSDMNWAMDKAGLTLHYFEESLANPKPEQQYFSVKVLILQPPQMEHIWLLNPEFDNEGSVFGVVGNNPINVTSVKLNQRIGIGRSQISDWMILENGRLIGGYTIRAMRAGLSGAALTNFDRSLGGMRVDEGVDYFKANGETPEGAIIALEEAYNEQNIENALVYKDFEIEAKLMLGSKSIPLNNPQLIKSTSELLKLSYIKNLQEKGIPKFIGVKRAFPRRMKISENHYVITIVYFYPDGVKQVQKMGTYKTDSGWKVLAPVN